MCENFKKIYVLMDIDIIEVSPGEYIFPVSHDSAIREMERGADVIYTHDPCFFNFDILDNGYDAVAMRWNNGDMKGVVLSELLNSKCNRYIDKEMRRGNNAYKMLMAGAFEFQSMMFEIPPTDSKAISILKKTIRGI